MERENVGEGDAVSLRDAPLAVWEVDDVAVSVAVGVGAGVMDVDAVSGVLLDEAEAVRLGVAVFCGM